jgi:predicted tellurium resistance membrane protein TerC
MSIRGIRYRLLVPKAHADGAAGKSVDDFWGAMRTIVVADALMGLDNVLAVAGAARGSFLLVILDLLISMPIVVWGGTVILKWVARLSIIVYVGAAVLAWTAVQMMLQDPIAMPLLQDRLALSVAVYLVVVIGVLVAGILADKGRRGRSPEALRKTL